MHVNLQKLRQRAPIFLATFFMVLAIRVIANSFIYGVLKGTVTGHLRNADDDHYQILVKAGSGANSMFRIAVNVHSSMKPPDLLFQSLISLPSS